MVEILGSLYDTELEYNDFKNKLKEVINTYVFWVRGLNDNTEFECTISNDGEISEVVESISYNKLIIDEIAVSELYRGNNLLWVPILYELELINQRYLIFNGICDENTIKIIKEMIINSELDEWECLSKNIKYSVFSSKLATNNTFSNLILLYKMIGKKLSEKTLEDFTSGIKKFLFIDCNEEYMYLKISEAESVDGEELFDQIVYYNPQWLEIFPQLQIEYYVDNKGYGIKRNYLELIDLKQYLEDADEKYATYLLNKIQIKKRRILS